MNETAVMQVLSEILRDVLDQPTLTVNNDSNAQSVEGWDSLAHINIVMAIEKHYKIKFALGELQKLKNVGEMAALIQKKQQSR